jgi:hypothetical protein
MWSFAIGFTVLLRGRVRRSFAIVGTPLDAVPVVCAGLLLWLATEALLTPAGHCGAAAAADVAPARWWSAWHHFAALALQIAVAIDGGTQARPRRMRF